MCHDHERGLCGFADVEVWRSSNPLDPIKPKGVGVVWLNNSLVISSPTSSELAMSLVNSRIFEHSMGHRISREDAHFHMHTVIGADPLVGLVVIKRLENRPIGRLPLV